MPPSKIIAQRGQDSRWDDTFNACFTYTIETNFQQLGADFQTLAGFLPPPSFFYKLSSPSMLFSFEFYTFKPLNAVNYSFPSLSAQIMPRLDAISLKGFSKETFCFTDLLSSLLRVFFASILPLPPCRVCHLEDRQGQPKHQNLGHSTPAFFQ